MLWKVYFIIINIDFLQYQCPKCGRVFIKRHHANYHMKTCGIVNVCDFCQKPFQNLDSLRRHLKFVHLKKRLYSCHVCHKQFKCKYDLNMHYNIHINFYFYCNECDACYTNRSNLLRHCKSVNHTPK